jgi:hypothetical protein
LAVLAIVFANAVGAVPVQWSGNGHWYEAVYVSDGIRWDDAKLATENVNGCLNGYLATSTSEAENNFIFSLISDPKFWFMGVWPAEYSFGPWLGGYQIDKTQEPAGNWQWVMGDPWSFTNWAEGEPNDNLGQEDYLHFFTNTNPGVLTPGPTWNDAPNTNLLRGYIVEWLEGPTVVEGTSWSRIKMLYR